MKREFIYAGSCGGDGIAVFRWDEATRCLELIQTDKTCQRPSWLAESGGILYSLDEQPSSAMLAAYRMDPMDGKLKLLSVKEIEGAGACHLEILGNRSAIAVSCYESGGMTICWLARDGTFLDQSRFYPGAARLDSRKSRFHQTILSPDGKKLFAVDLGRDEVLCYCLDQSGVPTGTPVSALHLLDGEGPRRMRFHPGGEVAYVLTEKSNRIYLCDVHDDTLVQRECFSLLPANFNGTAYGAEAWCTSDGRFLYATVRGLDRIVRFEIAPIGKTLRNREEFSCGGQFPRMAAPGVGGEYLFIANQKSDSLNVLPVDPTGGDLEESCCTAKVRRICVVLPLQF